MTRHPNDRELFDFDSVQANWARSMGGFKNVKLWDSVAPRYAELDLPDEADPFIALVQSKHILTADMRILDIGCGSGIYGLALAKYVREVVGCDFSSAMIDGARRQAAKHGIENVRFVQGDFHELAFDEPFDFVFAHMTPAVSDGAAFAKLMGLSRNWCAFVCPVRRTDHILEEAKRRAGVGEDPNRRDESFARAFLMVWLSGAVPEINHHKEEWRPERKVEDMKRLCREQADGPLSAQQAAAIDKYLESIADAGIVHERIETTIMQMLWRTTPTDSMRQQ